jgi:pyrroloquinoline-quinone synthase
LDHPFYQDWKEGKLTIEDLQLYAGQYYHFEANFSRFLSAIHSRCSDPAVRQIILSNLWDEEHGEDNHRALWLGFCAGLGLTPEQVEQAPVQPKTQALVDTYSDICSTRSFQEGLAAIYAYEVQVPQVVAEKLAGLRDRYGITNGNALAFFQVHQELDEEHSRLEAEAISAHTSGDNESAVVSALQAGLDAWWGFLDGVNDLRAGVRAAA